jgi:hypothetical protein
MANQTDCNICCEKTNSSTRKVVECNFCSFDLCRTCFQTYIADPAVTVPVCMNPVCKKELSDDFIQDNVSKVFYGKEYRNKVQQKILDTDASFFPVTQMLLHCDTQVSKITGQIDEAHELINELTKKLNSVYEERRALLTDENIGVTGRKVVQFIKACPNTCCKGFLSTDWNCSLCETDVCKTCHEIVKPVNDSEDAHVCDPDTLKTVARLKKDCKACPKCASSIYKISGCDQMFCTSCHTAFSWSTLEIELGRMHNPHYYQWMRDNNNGVVPREREDEAEGDGGCNVDFLPIARSFQNNIDPSLLETDTMKTVWDIYMLVNHIEAVELMRFPATRQVLLNTNMVIRKSFMTNEIDEVKYRSVLYKRDKDSRKKNDYNGVMTLFAQVIKERINFLYSRRTRGTVYITESQLDTLITEAVALKEYFNNATAKISKKYGCIQMHMDDRWRIVIVN